LKAKMNNFNAWIKEVNPETLNSIFLKLLKENGFTVIKVNEHSFDPYGFTALYLLGESHFAIHTFPEEEKTYIELSSCVDKPFDNFLSAFYKENITTFEKRVYYDAD